MELAQLVPSPARTAASLSSRDDEKLVAEIVRGSDAAFEALYDRHCPGMLGLARQMLNSPSEAEDAVQGSFMSAYRQMRDGVTPAYPRAWLYAIVRNRCLTVLRDRREVPGEVAEPSTAGLAEEVERRSDLRELLRSMQRLPEDQRTALALFELGGLSQAEIAQAMDCEPDRVKALVYQARTNLLHARAARDQSCQTVRTQLATLRGGRLNSRELRAHVRGCEGCAEYALAVREQRRRLAIVLPVIPLVALKAPLAGGGAEAGAVGVSAIRKLWWARPRPSVAMAAAAGTGLVAAGVAAAVVASGGDDPQRRKPPARPAAVAPAAAASRPAAPAPVARPAAPARRAAKKRKRHRAVAPKPAPASAPQPAQAEPVKAPATTEAAPAAPPSAVRSTPPAQPQPQTEPPGQDFDLPDPGPPPGSGQLPDAGQTPASQPEAPALP